MAEVEVMNRRPFQTHFVNPSSTGPSRASSLSVLGIGSQARSRVVQTTRSCTNTPMTRTGTMPVESYLSQVNEITEGLFLCGARALRPQRLLDMGISCIFNVTIELPNLPIGKEHAKDIECIKIAVEDSPYTNLGYYFDKAADKIDEVMRSQKKVLVHCVAGVSRSASIIIAYLMKHKGMTLRRAFQHVKSRRPIIRPNPGFFRQLIDFETRIHGKASVKMVWNAAAGGNIPDLYEPEYNNTLNFLNKYGCLGQGDGGSYTSWVNHLR